MMVSLPNPVLSGDGRWAVVSFSHMLGLTTACEAWMHDACTETRVCACHCHDKREERGGG